MVDWGDAFRRDSYARARVLGLGTGDGFIHGRVRKVLRGSSSKSPIAQSHQLQQLVKEKYTEYTIVKRWQQASISNLTLNPTPSLNATKSIITSYKSSTP